MARLTKAKALELIKTTTKENHLLMHALAVSVAMGAMAKHFDGDVEEWEAVGILHDYDYELYPEEHLKHTETPLSNAGVDDELIRAILSHGYGICTDVEPKTDMEKSLYTVDCLTGLISATAKMRPNGITDLEPNSVVKKFKDKSFASGVDRDVINKGIEMLGIDRVELITICINGMKSYASELGLMPKTQ